MKIVPIGPAPARWFQPRGIAHAARVVVISGLALAGALPLAARAQPAWPAHDITLIVPFPPGGSTDLVARIVADALRPELGRPVIVENRSGAGGSIGTAAIVRAAPDGYVTGMGTASTLAINPATYRNLGYDVLKDLAPVSNVAATPNIMTINPAVPAANMAQFLAYVRARPGKLSYASSGVGSVAHLMGEQFNMASGAALVHIPYRGVGPALSDVAAGHVEVMFDNLPTSLPFAEDGRLRPLAVSGGSRTPKLPETPTFAELGMTDLDWMAFFGIVAPAATPPPVVRRLNEAILRVLDKPDVRARLATQEAVIIGNSPEAFAAEIAREIARHARAAAAANIQVE